MTDAEAGGERGIVYQRIAQRSLEDESFRRQLLADPRAAVEQALGTRLPGEVRVVALEETADTVYLVLPPSSPATGRDGELSDSELETVAGGDWGPSTNSTCGGNTCQFHCSTV